jgi:hypothetical protein
MSKHPADSELLGYIDSELPAPLAADIERHLEQCPACTTEYRTLRFTSGDAAELCRGAAIAPGAVPEARQRLTENMLTDVERRRARRAPIVLGLTAALLFLTVRYETAFLGRSLFVERGALPVSSFTPGVAQIMSTDEVCSETLRVPPRVPPAMRLQVLRDYGMEHVPQDQYELDYLITPELGGMTDRRNLWPEPYGLRSWNAHAKDSLENLLPRLVCSGRIDLATAQQEMASNWIDAYKKYLATERPIQLNARLLLPTEPTRD